MAALGAGFHRSTRLKPRSLRYSRLARISGLPLLKPVAEAAVGSGSLTSEKSAGA